MTAQEILVRLESLANPEDAAGATAYHKNLRRHLGVRTPVLNEMAKELRQSLVLDQRLALADGLWRSNIHEARVLAAKVFAQSRIRPDDSTVWAMIASWVQDFDGWAIADHVCDAGQRRLLADPFRIDEVERWTTSDNMWIRRAALVITLPWTKQNHPSKMDLAIREQALGWAAAYVQDRDSFIQKAIAWWLRDLSRHDPARTRAFLDLYGEKLTGFARKEAARHLI